MDRFGAFLKVYNGNSKRLTYVTSFYRSIKVNQSTECQYCSRLRWNIGRFMSLCLYALFLRLFFGNPPYLSQTLSNFLIRTMFTGKVFFCVLFLPSQDALLTVCLFVSERAQHMVVCMACMVIRRSIVIAPDYSRCLAGYFPLWFRSDYILQLIEKFNWFPCQWWALVRLRLLPHSISNLYYSQLSRSNRELWKKKLSRKFCSIDTFFKFRHKVILRIRWFVGGIIIEHFLKTVITNVCNAESLLCKFLDGYWKRHQPCGGHVCFSSSIKNGIPGVSVSASHDIKYEINTRWR